MTIRTDEEQLRELLDCGATPNLEVFMAIASQTVDALLISSGLSAEVLKLVETFLAAHFYTLTKERGTLASQTMGDATDRFHNVYTKGFGATRFGQQALVLDTSGTLASESAKADSPVTKQAEFRIV